MKLLLENWRSYLSEQQSKTLSVFDFDDTIAITGNFADAFDKETGEFVKRLDSEETELAKTTGTVDGKDVVLDFSDFNKEVRSPVGEISSVTDIIRDRLKDSSTQVMVMTARGPESEEAIQNYLNTLKYPIETNNMIIKGVTGGDKGEWIRSYLEANEGFTEVEFYDDQDKNINNVLRTAETLPNVTFSIYKVLHGEIKRVQ
jgi:hypothetical protein|tara:strand:- start:69 stop:674 length:606 start_codon:yes stop_codon:yes gene_type:complete